MDNDCNKAKPAKTGAYINMRMRFFNILYAIIHLDLTDRQFKEITNGNKKDKESK